MTASVKKRWKDKRLATFIIHAFHPKAGKLLSDQAGLLAWVFTGSLPVLRQWRGNQYSEIVNSEY